MQSPRLQPQRLPERLPPSRPARRSWSRSRHRHLQMDAHRHPARRTSDRGVGLRFLHLPRWQDRPRGLLLEDRGVARRVCKTEGLVIGPHLYWGMNWLDVRVDPACGVPKGGDLATQKLKALSSGHSISHRCPDLEQAGLLGVRCFSLSCFFPSCCRCGLRCFKRTSRPQRCIIEQGRCQYSLQQARLLRLNRNNPPQSMQ